MADDDDEDAWASELDGKQQPSVGVSKDVLRKARALNPSLAAQGSTTEIFQQMKSAKGSAAPSASQVKTTIGSGVIQRVDFAAAFYQLQQKYKEDRKKVQEEISKLQKQLAEFGPKTLEKLVDLVIEVDPNLTSPQTHEILKSEAPFLNEVGFAVRKVIDKKMKKK